MIRKKNLPLLSLSPFWTHEIFPTSMVDFIPGLPIFGHWQPSNDLDHGLVFHRDVLGFDDENTSRLKEKHRFQKGKWGVDQDKLDNLDGYVGLEHFITSLTKMSGGDGWI